MYEKTKNVCTYKNWKRQKQVNNFYGLYLRSLFTPSS
jgi:hypothetical protein